MTGWLRRGALLLVCGSFAGCAVRDAACAFRSQVAADDQAQAELAAAATAGTAASGAFTIAFLGDSLTVGIGLRSDDAYPTLIQKRFATQGYRVEVVNASVIGQTTADGLRQLPSLLEPNVRILVVALGSNDATRGIAVAQTYENLSEIIDTARMQGVAVLLAGMDPPVTLGVDYKSAFRGLYIRLANDDKESLVYLPSLLAGVAGNAALNQEDGLRPNADGAKVIAETMFGALQVMVDGMGGGG